MALTAYSLLTAVLMIGATQDVLAGRLKPVSTSSHSKQPFQCPPECLECCQKDTWFSSGTFKCTLKDTEAARAAIDGPVHLVHELVKDRTCRNVSPKNSMPGSFKIRCKYKDNEETTVPEKCSSNFKCCCDQDNGWSERRCFNSQEPRQREISNRSSELEDYKLVGTAEETMANMDGCKRPTSTHHPYEIPPPSGSRPGHATKVSSGCCLKTETKKVTHRWSTSHMQMGRPPRMVRRSHSDTKTYTVCAEHERLYKCSGDGGLTWSGGFVFERLPSDKMGTCIGDQQPDPSKGLQLTASYYSTSCPHSTFEGAWCQCSEACPTR